MRGNVLSDPSFEMMRGRVRERERERARERGVGTKC